MVLQRENYLSHVCVCLWGNLTRCGKQGMLLHASHVCVEVGRGSVASCGKKGKLINVSRMGRTGTRCVT